VKARDEERGRGISIGRMNKRNGKNIIGRKKDDKNAERKKDI
jgi:hypothetical protein